MTLQIQTAAANIAERSCQNPLIDSVRNQLPIGVRNQVRETRQEEGDLIVVLADGRELRFEGIVAGYGLVESAYLLDDAGCGMDMAPSQADGMGSAAADLVSLGRLEEMFFGRTEVAGEALPQAETFGLSDTSLGAIAIAVLIYIYTQTDLITGDDDEGPPPEPPTAADMFADASVETLMDASPRSADTLSRSYDTVFGEGKLAEFIEAYQADSSVVEDVHALLVGLLNVVESYYRSDFVEAEDFEYDEGEVEISLDVDDDDTTDVMHIWTLADEESDQLKVEVDLGANGDYDVTLFLNPAQQTASTIVAGMDQTRDGTVDAFLYAGDGTNSAELVFERMEFLGDSEITVREEDVSYLTGLQVINLATDGSTRITVTSEQLLMMGAGERLVINGGADDLVLVPDGSVSRVPQQNRDTYYSWMVGDEEGVEILVDKDVTFGVGEGDWQELLTLRQMQESASGTEERIAGLSEDNAGNILQAYEKLYGKENADELRSDPASSDAERFAQIQGLSYLYGAYENSIFEPTTTFGPDRVIVDLDTDGDGTKNLIHIWELEEDGNIALLMDFNADNTSDLGIRVAQTAESRSLLEAAMDFDGDGTTNAAVTDLLAEIDINSDGSMDAVLLDSGASGADFRFDRIVFRGDLRAELTEAHARLLAGVSTFQLATDGNTELTISGEAVTLLIDGDGDGTPDPNYELRVDADVGDLLTINGEITQDPSQNTASRSAYMIQGATILADSDAVVPVGEGDWPEMARLRQLDVTGIGNRINQYNAGWVERAYEILYGEDAFAALVEDPGALGTTETGRIEGLVQLVDAYLSSDFDVEPAADIEQNQVIININHNEDGTADAIHTWTIDEDNLNLLRLAVDHDANDVNDQTFTIEFTEQPSLAEPDRILLARVDFSGDGVSDAQLQDGSAITPADMQFDRLTLDADLIFEMSVSQAGALAGLASIQLRGSIISGATVQILDATLTALADGDGDGVADAEYALNIGGPPGSTLRIDSSIRIVDDNGDGTIDSNSDGDHLYRGSSNSLIIVDPSIQIDIAS